MHATKEIHLFSLSFRMMNRITLYYVKKVTAEKVKDHLKEIVEGEIIRYEVPNISALQFTCHHALLRGVTSSMSMDIHGKSLNFALLEMEINIDQLG